MQDITRKPVLWGLDPLFHVHVKLFAGTLGRMKPGQWGDGDSVYFTSFVRGYPRPVRLASLAGLIVFISKHQKFTRFLIDDGTGTARCMLWATTDSKRVDLQQILLGDFVEVRGRLEWREKMPLINVQSYEVSSDPHAEVLWWVECNHTYETVYLQKSGVNLSPDRESSLSQRFST